MQKMQVLRERRVGKEKFANFNLVAFAKKTFGMYGGQDTQVMLLCDNSLIGVMLDRFGQDAPLVPLEAG